MEHTAWFESWFGSPYYTILYQHRDEQEAQAFIEKLLAHLNPPAGCRMVDIACGEGRYAIQLEEHGYDVTGIDLSHLSIEKAKAAESDTLHFYVHDMRFPFYINYFDYAFNFFTSFGYFQHDRDHMMAAKSFAAALKPGGTLVIDYLNSNIVIQKLVAEEKVVRGSYIFNIRRQVAHHHIVKDIRFTDADGKERHYTESVAAFSKEDFENMFTKAGLHLQETFGDYQLNPFDATASPRLIMVFKK